MQQILDHTYQILSDICSDLKQPLAFNPFQGKLLRPQLCIAAASDAQSPHLPLIAAAIECIHTASLLHDDILDNAPTRHARAALWRLHGPKSAILFGDLLLCAALRLAQQVRSWHSLDVITQATYRTIKGELSQQYTHIPHWRTYIRIAAQKTASLFVAATTAQEHSKARKRIGTLFGIAHQLTNDPARYRIYLEPQKITWSRHA